MTQVLGRALTRAGHQVRVIGVYSRAQRGPSFEVDRGVRIWRLEGASHRPGRLMSRWRLLRTVTGWSRSGEIDLVEAPDWEGWVAGWPRLPIPVVVRLNGSAVYFAAETGERAPFPTSWLERAAIRRADFRCAASHYVARRTQELFQLPGAPPLVLHNAIDVPPLRPGAERAVAQVVFAGTLTGKKGVVSLILAWRLVARDHPAAELHVYGRDGLTATMGSMRQHLRSLLPEGPAGRVIFHGAVSREALAVAFQRAALAVFPSRAEAFALAPLEAMANACPTVVGNRTSGPEVIAHERDGLLVDPEDPRDIASTISRLLSDPALRHRLGRAGRHRVEEAFSIQRLAPLNASFYRHCVARFHGIDERN